MKLHLPVKLRASLIAAVIAVSSSVYNAAYAYDHTGTNIDMTEVYNRTSGDTYTASDNITFAAGQYTQDKLVSYISGETTLTADTVNFNNNFGPNSADLTVESDKTYNGNVNIIADDIKVAPGAKVILEDVAIVERTPEFDNEGYRVYDGADVVVNELGDLVVLNGSADAIDEAVKKQLNIQNLHDTPTVTQRPNDEQTVRLGDVTGKGNMALIGSGADAKDTMRTENIGTVDQRFGNVAIYGADVTTGKVNANTVGIAQSDVATDAFTSIGLDVDADSTLTSTDTITAGQPTGHVAIYGAVTAENNITLAHGTATDKDGLHPGSSVTSNHGNVTLIDIHADQSTVEATEGDVTIMDQSIVEGSVITAGEDVNVWNSTMKPGKDAEGNPIRNTVTAGDDMDINRSNVAGTDAEVADDLSIGNSIVNDSTFKVGDDTAITNSTVKDTTITATGEDSSLEVNNSDLTNTDVTGLASDIVIKGHSNLTSNKEAGFVISTSGTSLEADADGYTGGSIIIDKAAISHGTITSGKDVVVDPSVEVTKDGTGIGMNLPFGEINIHDSEVSDMTISTAKGHVILRGSENPSQTPSTPIASNNNAKGINSFTTSLSALGVETDGNKNVLSIGVAARSGSATNNSDDVYVSLRIKDGGDIVAVSTNTAKFTTNNTTPTFSFWDLALDPSKTYTFEFVKADGTLANVDLALKTGAGDKPSPVVGHTDWSAIVTAKLATNTVTDSTISTGAGHIEIIHSGVTDSAISTGEGSIAINDSVIMASDKRYITEEVEGVTVTKPANTITSEGNGNLFVEHDSTVSKTSISAEGISYNEDGAPVSDKNYIVDSTVMDSDITLWGTGADLEIGAVEVIGVAPDTTTVNHPAKVLGQTSLFVDDTITVKAGSTINLNGGAEDMNANIDADKLHIESVATEHATLTNGQIAIGTETVITGSTHANGQWLDLTNVNTKPVTAPAPLEEQGEGETTGLIVPGTLGNLIEKSGNAGVNILNSNVEIDAIYSKDSDDVASINHYFKYVNIGKDSTVDVNEDAFVDVYREAHWDSHHDTAGKGSTVTFEKNASLKDAYIWGTDNDSTAQGKFDTQTIVNGEAHIGNLNLSHEGVLSIINATEAEEGKGTLDTPVTDTHSYIANIGKADGNTSKVHGVLNVVGGTLTTPKLNQGEYMTVGLNGGIIELGAVTAAQGATVASAENSVNAHVNVRAITDAAATGVTDTIGESTIRTTLDRVVTPYSYNAGTLTTATAHIYYYVAIADGVLTDGTTVSAGDIIARSDSSLIYYIKADGTQVPAGVNVVEEWATTLDANDATLLTRVEELWRDEEGNLSTTELPNGTKIVQVGQVYTEETLTYYEGVSEEVGTVETVTDGIASLTVKNDFSANKTTIKAYETGTADNTTGIVTADPNTGFIKIDGDVSGNKNTLIADNDINIGTVTGSENTITSNRGTVTIGDIGTAAEGETEAAPANKNTISGVNVVTGDIVGDGTGILAQESITTGDITGDSSFLFSYGTVETGDITGDSNTLAAVESTETGSITGSENTLSAGTTITTGDIEGDSNDLAAGESIETGSVTGDSNELTAGTSITTGDIAGNENELKAGTTITTGDIEGDGNVLTAVGTTTIDTPEGEEEIAVGAIETGDITGSENVLASSTTITTGDIEGDSNGLAAGESIETGSITGDENTLVAGTTITTGDITGVTEGQGNTLTAEESITTGAISGDSNELTAGTTITTGAIEGDGNILDAVEDIHVQGDVAGDANSITSATGDITVDGTIDGAANEISAEQGSLSIGGIDGTAADATAHGTIEIGKLSGTDQTVLAYATDLSKDDVAIHIGEFNAEGSSVGIATTTSPVYGTATGNGSIVIDSMTAVEGPDADPSLVNTIVSNNSFVHIGSMDGSNAYTQITAATTVTVGSPFTFATGADTGANMAIKGQDFVIASTDGVELTDSTVNVTDSITGSALTLTTTGTEKFISSADTVTLGSLTLGGAAMLNANQVDVDTLTIDGANATLDSTYVTADTVVLKNGGQLGSTRVDATNLTVQDSSFGFTSLNGIDSLTIDNSQGSIQQALTGLTGDVTVTNDSTLNMQSGLATDGKITVDNGSILVGATTVTGKDSIEVNDGTLQAVTITTDGDLSATDGNVNASSSIAAGALKAEGSTVTATNGITLNNGNMTAKDGSTIGANVTGAKDVTITDSTAKDIAMTGDLTANTAEIGKVTGAKNVSLTDTTAGAIAMNGTLTADNATTGKVTGTVTEATISNGSDIAGPLTTTGNATVSDSAIHGALTAEGDATTTNSTIDGAVSGANTSITGGSAASATATTGTVSTDGATIAGAVTGATGATVNGGSAASVTTTTGTASATNATIAGAVTGADAAVTGGTTGNVVATTGDATINGATVGNVTAAAGTADLTNATAGTVNAKDADITGGTAASVTATEGATLTDATVNGTVQAADATITGGTTGNVIATTGDATINGAQVGTVTANAGTADLTNTVAGAVSAKDATITGGTTASVAATEGATLTDATVNGTVQAADATITGGTTGNVVATTGDATINGAQVGTVTATAGTADLTNTVAGAVSAKDATITGGTTASVAATEGATLTDATVNGTVQAADATITGGTTGNVVATTGDATITGAQVGNVTANAGTADLTNATAGTVNAKDAVLTAATTGAVTATGSTTVKSASTTDALSTKDLTVADGASVTADTVTANGKLDVQGDVTADSVALTGTTGSVISGADVTATAGNTTLAGEITADDTTLKGTQVAVNGTLNAGKDVTIDGTLAGNGTINKTGGDTLTIADANGNVAINVKDASTLQLADGTKVGNVDASANGATLTIGEEGSIDTVTVDKLTLGNKSTLVLDTNLDTGKADKVNGPAALNGATIKLATMGDETKIADQTSIKLFDSVSSAAAADVEHDMKTLNAYAKGNSVVLSKNYRGAEGLTKNQKSTAAALADVQDTMAPVAEMADMFDALGHTRSEADAVKALDSLSGAGLATMSKMVTDEAHDHLQTLRGTMKSLSAGVTSRYDENGHRIEGLNSSAITAVATGGTTRINDDNNAEDYTRNSYGVQLAGVHALSDAWTGGISAAYSHATGDCGPVDIETEGLFLDIAVMHKGYRVTQTASLGCGHFDIDTERMVNVAAAGHDFSGKAEGSTSAMAVTISYEAVATILTTEDRAQDLSAVFQADIVHAQFDSFTESGLGNAGLISEIDDVTSASCAIGARYTANFGEETNPGYFMAEALFVADAGDREAKINNRFIGGGQSFELSGPDAGSCGLRLNAGVLVPVGNNVGLFGNVSGEFRAHQTSVSGGVGVKVAF